MNPTNRKVFIANYQDKDFSSADQFGEVVFVTKGFVPLHDMTKVRNGLKKFVDLSSQHDYLVINGPSVIVTLLSILWFTKHGYLNVLSWDGKTSSYRPFVVGIDSITEQLDMNGNT